MRWVQQKTRLGGLTERDDAGRWRLTPAARNALTPAAPGIVVTVFETDAGLALWGEAEAVESLLELRSVDLVLVSPPDDLAAAKRSGGRRGTDYEKLAGRARGCLAQPAHADRLGAARPGRRLDPGEPAQSLY